MRTAIVGVGNILMRDDGVGVHVAWKLIDTPLPADVDVTDAGTSAEAAFSVAGADRDIVVDAVRLGGSPGTVYRLTADDAAADEEIHTCHDAGLIDALRAVAEAQPEIVIFGVEPGEIEWGLGLSEDVAAAVGRVVEVVNDELKGAQCS